MEEQLYQPKGEDEVSLSNSPISHSVQCRGMATNSNTNEKAERCPIPSQHFGHLEGQSNK